MTLHACTQPWLRRLVPALVAVAAAAAFARGAAAADAFDLSPEQMQALGVQLQPLERPAAGAGPTYAARVVLPPAQEGVISAPTAGVVDRLLVAEHDTVRAGQPLVRLASHELGDLQLDLAQAASKARLSQRTLERERSLHAEGIIAERRVLEAEATAADDAARRRHTEAALRLAGLDAAAIARVAAGGPMQDAVVLHARAPGVVVAIEAKPGQRVAPADPLLRIADTRRLWIDVQLPAAQRAQVAPGATLSGVGRDFSARALNFGAVVSDDQTIALRAEVTRGAEALRIGEAVQVRVPFAAGGWAVPLAALARQDERAWVFVRSERGFVATPVTVIGSGGGTLVVEGALSAGQQVAVTSVIALKAAWLAQGGSR